MGGISERRSGRYPDDDDDDDDRPRRGRPVDDHDGDDDDDRPSRRSSRRDERPPSRGFRCPYCDSDRMPAITKEISQVGWVVFILLLCSVAFCWLCWIGLFIREEKRKCRDCGMKLG